MLLDFTRKAGRGGRGLLVQPDGKVIVDTEYQAGSTEWKEKFRLINIDDAGEEMAGYYRDIIAGKADATTAREVRTKESTKLLGHARLKHPDWVLMVLIDRGSVD